MDITRQQVRDQGDPTHDERRSAGTGLTVRRGRPRGLLAGALVATAALALLPATVSPAAAQRLAGTVDRSSQPSAARAAQRAPRARYCHGRRATIVGTEHDDVLRGTRHADVIVGLGGNDIILGGRGRDLICGGSGADMLNAMQGHRQRVFGGSGADFCFAPALSDHRFHFQCEAHVPSGLSARTVASRARGVLGVSRRERSQRVGAASSVGEAPTSLRVRAARRGYDPSAVWADKATCDSLAVGEPGTRTADGHVDVYATAAWQGPSRVAIVPVYWTWTAGGWSAPVTDYTDAGVFSVDAFDGTAGRFPLRAVLPSTSAAYYLGYYFLWQNPNTGEYDQGGLNYVTDYADTLYGYGGSDQNLGFCYTAPMR